jgi:hypothetical protein
MSIWFKLIKLSNIITIQIVSEHFYPNACGVLNHFYHKSHFKVALLCTLSLPEFTSLPSAGGFAERFFSGAQQKRLCREPNKKHSAKPLHSAKKALPSV